jgi:hypothetical protein
LSNHSQSDRIEFRVYDLAIRAALAGRSYKDVLDRLYALAPQLLIDSARMTVNQAFVDLEV